ncbi:MAG: hypothetical protein HFE97_12850 [Oscillospiraceae bacterium]|nr:hypothetical protein [Oscillospiraceae bacterium]
MNYWLSSIAQLQAQNHAMTLEQLNRQSEPFGLSLSKSALNRLLQHRAETLRNTKRIEFGEGVLGKLIAAFCDSPYIAQSDYEKTLLELQELFYLFKNECHDLVSDDELIGAMHLIYNDVAKGSTEYLSGIDWKTMYQIAVTSSISGTELEEPTLEGFLDGAEYES